MICLHRLPGQIQCVLFISFESLDRLTVITDKVAEMMQILHVFARSAVNSNQPETSLKFELCASKIEELFRHTFSYFSFKNKLL